MPLVVLFFVCAMPTYSLFINNVGEIRFIEAFIIMAAAYAIGLALFGFLWLVLRNRMVSGLIASASLFLFMNFSTIYDAIHKNVVQVHVGYISYAISIVTVVLLSGILIYITTISPLIPKTITLFFLIAVTSNIFINTAFAAPGIIETAARTSSADVRYEDASDYDIKASLGRAKPNIYFIITDEYASFPCLKKYYHYDNAEFYDFLTENKFNISRTSYSYSDHTYECLAALAALQPLKVVPTKNELKEQILEKDNLQYQLLEKLGYDIQGVSAHKIYPFKSTGKRSIISDTFKSTAENGDNTLKIILDRTMLYWLSPHVELSFAKSSSDTYTTTESVIDYLATGKYLENSSPTAYFCYILSPHVPFTHDEHGNRISTEYRSAWGVPKIYLGHLKYTTGLLMGAIENILENDPDSVIILQSDHGVRHHRGGEPPHTFIVEETDTRSILNTVYFSGQSLDIQGLSAVNTWRLVFNKLGVEMDLIDDSSYMITVDVDAEVMDVQ